MASRTERTEARLAPEAADKIRQAAALSGTSTSAFIVDAASDRADRVLKREHVTEVTTEYFDRLLVALDEPAAVVSELKSAAQRFDREAVGDGDSYIIRRRATSRRPRSR